jgi:hypothetical protein
MIAQTSRASAGETDLRRRRTARLGVAEPGRFRALSGKIADTRPLYPRFFAQKSVQTKEISKINPTGPAAAVQCRA